MGRHAGVVVALVFVLALGAVPAAAQGTCPGLRACVPSKGCGPASIQVKPPASIQQVINGAPSGASICVLPGTYLGKIDFKGKAITLQSSGGAAVTILKGSGTPSGPVVTFKTFEGADSVLDGFTVTGGTAQFGGGIYVENASPTIRNCIVKGNSASGLANSRGGGAWVRGASARPSITCTDFVSNSAAYGGGGLGSAFSADPYLRLDRFKTNSAQFGGGIGVQIDGRLDVATSEFDGNVATVDGGGIHSGTAYGNALVRNCWLHGNRASREGGGLFVPDGFAQVMNCTFDGNRAQYGGGASADNGAVLDVGGTIFVNNVTTGGASAALSCEPPAQPKGNAIVNHYNDFFNNSGGDWISTVDNVGLLTANPHLLLCCPPANSPLIDAGLPDPHFDDVNGTANDIGACGGPALP